MQLRLSCLCCALLLSAPVVACTPDEATAKAEELANKVAQVTEQNPDRAAELHQQLEEKNPETQADELRNDCEAYEQRMREMDELDRQQQ